jgi:hypothetical protein
MILPCGTFLRPGANKAAVVSAEIQFTQFTLKEQSWPGTVS